ncbi:glycine cleavage system protein R [Moritella yayanosii]|uniref:Glycine cleavage system transcriptional repressor n=1 Tax=Moritella yayanosii TaxID=69539 RepID=A0A330LTR4_9GAMM|nr:ACT domain-containing protein [Moritella yayanosii]SQD80347.1 DNA-binding transcriptional repressor, regulatory protein accessory to GcvA [Moritella yayanosii]
MTQNLVITALGSNSPGIVHKLIGHVSNCGCNIVDSRLAIFGNEFTLIMLLSGEWNAIIQLESSLPIKSQELDLITMMKRTERHEPISYDHTIEVEVTIPDATGIIEKFTLFFTNNNLNLAGLRSEILTAADNSDILKAHFTLNTTSDCDLAVLKSELSGLCTILNAEYHFTVDNKVITA